MARGASGLRSHGDTGKQFDGAERQLGLTLWHFRNFRDALYKERRRRRSSGRLRARVRPTGPKRGRMMGSIRTLHSVCRHCGTKLIPGKIHCWEDGPICGNCAGIRLFGRESWQYYRSTQDEIARLVNLIERWDREDVVGFQSEWSERVRIFHNRPDRGGGFSL